MVAATRLGFLLISHCGSQNNHSEPTRVYYGVSQCSMGTASINLTTCHSGRNAESPFLCLTSMKKNLLCNPKIEKNGFKSMYF